MSDGSRGDVAAPVAAGLNSRIAILMAADEGYSAPLAVCVGSLLEHLTADIKVDLFLIGAGMTPSSLSHLESWWGDRVALRELVVPPEPLAALRDLLDGRPLLTHLRGLLASILPGDVSKVIYLDADILVQRDVSAMWRQDMGGNIVLAVQDSYIQNLPGYCLPANEMRSGAEPYFNSGVMLIDVDAWRAGGVEAAFYEELQRLGSRARWYDQDVLNACLRGRWGALPPVWNRQFALGLYPDWRCSPHSEEEFRQARSEPAIVHFCSRTKPWHRFCDHPDEDVRDFRSWLRRVPFDLGPSDPPTLYERTLEVFAAPHRRVLDTLAAAVRSRRRRHAMAMMLPGILRQAAEHPWTLISVPLAVLRDRAKRRRSTAS